MKKKSLLLLVVVLIMSLAMFGCGADEPAAQAPAGDTQAAAPAPKADSIEWVVQAYGAVSTPIFYESERIVNSIEAMAGDALNIELLPSGAVLAIADMLDGCEAGTIDAFNGYWGGYTGVIPACGFYMGLPGYYMDETAAQVWLRAYGGEELLQEAVAGAGYDLRVFVTGLQTSEVFMFSNKPVKSVDDLKGMKIRGQGYWAQVAAELGATPISVAGGEVYTSLERGVVDGIEYGAPCHNDGQGFTDIAKYVTVPGVHQSWMSNIFSVNGDSWAALTPELQAIIEGACAIAYADNYPSNLKLDLAAWKTVKAEEASGKIEIFSLHQSDLDKMNAITMKICEKMAAEDEYCKKIFDSQTAFMQEYLPYIEDFAIAE